MSTETKATQPAAAPMAVFLCLSDRLRERNIAAIRDACVGAFERGDHREAALRFQDLAAAVAARSPRQVARMERERGIG